MELAEKIAPWRICVLHFAHHKAHYPLTQPFNCPPLAPPPLAELMASNDHQLPADLCNSLADTACFVNNVDAALAMVEAMSRSNTEITQETYVALLEALIRDTSHRSSEEATLILRAMIVDSDLTPGLSLFAKVGNLCIREER